MSGKELFIRFTARAFHNLLSIYVFNYFLFGSEGRIWDLIVSVPDHCLFFLLFIVTIAKNFTRHQTMSLNVRTVKSASCIMRQTWS